MKHRNVGRSTTAAASAGGPTLPDLLESQIAELRQMNARLQQRLEEVEMDAELQIQADRILAISPPMDT